MKPTGVQQAWIDGSPDGGASLLQGQGVKVGVVDSGAQSGIPALAGRIAWYANYAGTDTSTQDAFGHGTLVTAEIGGVPVAQGAYGHPFRGGVAPASSLYVARALTDTGTGSDLDFVQAIDDMSALGVRLFNLSVASSTSITEAVTKQTTEGNTSLIWEAKNYGTVLTRDALLVWAAGNFGDADVAQAAGLPYVAPQYAHHWLAVVNVALDKNGQVTGLDASVPSNACGVAAAWCLAAPGTFYGVPLPGTQFADGVSEGTSNAAPIVTGVAALVWQAFPWMSASNVQETLLGTATPLGDPAVYGYGLVNADKAVKGPARLDWGSFQVSVPDAVTATFANDMSGSGSVFVVNMGSGKLVLSGQDTYTGGTTVQSGVLQVNGSLGSAVQVNAGGILAGNGGVVNANVTSVGTVSTQYGTLGIHGDYLAQVSAVTIVRAGTPLVVSGASTITGSTLAVDVPTGYVAKSSEPMIQSAGGLTGRFGALTVAGGVYLSGTMSYTPTEADVSLSREPTVSVAAAAASPAAANIQQSARNIDQALAQADQWTLRATPGHESFLAAAADFQRAPDLAAAAASIDSLSGQIHASSMALTLEQGQIVTRVIADRLADGASDAGAWAQLTASDGAIGRSGYATGNVVGGGAVAGADARLGDGVVAGIAVDWNTLRADYDGLAGTSRSNTSGVSLYARYDADEVYVDGRVGEDWVRSRVSRRALLGEVGENITTDRDDRLVSAYVESGLRLGDERHAVTPFAGALVSRLDRGAFSEVGANGWGLDAARQTYTQASGLFGVRLDTDWDWSGGHSRLSASASWQSLFSGEDTRVHAAFVGAPDAVFDVAGVQVPRHMAWLGVGLTTQARHGWSWFVNADGQVSGGPTRSINVTAGVRRAL